MTAMMICRRCGTRCPDRVEGLCLHCVVAKDIDEATGGGVTDGRVKEGFPEWEKPRRGDYYRDPENKEPVPQQARLDL